MDGAWPELILIAVLVSINAVLSGTEVALISLREPQLARLEDQGRSGQIVARLARDPNRYLATVQIGITLAGFMASAVAATSLAEPLIPAFSWAGNAAETVAIVVVTILLAFLTLVLGELSPKRLALQRAEGWAMVMARPLDWFSTAMTPFVWLLSVSTDAVVRLFGGTPGATRQEVDLGELRDTILATGGLSQDHSEVFLGAFDIVERTVVEIMTPRTDVATVEVSSTVGQGIDAMIDSGFSRLPVTPDDHGLDAAIGIVNIADLVRVERHEPLLPHIREVPIFPETVDVLTALRTLQQVRLQMGFVVDEFGGVEGIVTTEDIVEEIVGEIYDEEDTDVASVRMDGDGSFLVPGRFPVHDLVDVGIHVPGGNFTTVAGLVLAELGHLPEVGESVTVEQWHIEVVELDATAISEVRFTAADGA
ncbi:MAG: HlyC/CorC family transporter [Armatimonadetes bacterium]|nr:MAG: HlyC/CorC family transporter [Armatimonadota bacterium]